MIAGGGLAGQRCAEALRRSGYDGPIRMLCAEAHRPYDRPPLSKELSPASTSIDELPFRRARLVRAAADRAAARRRRERAVARRAADLPRPTARACATSKLLIATGSRPRTLPLLEGYENVSVLRTVDDSSGSRETLARAPAACGARRRLHRPGGRRDRAQARRGGRDDRGRADARCTRSSARELGDWFTRFHRERGVDVINDATVTRDRRRTAPSRS